MNAATITQAQDKGLRHQSAGLLGAVRSFAEQLFVAHGGWLAARKERADRASYAVAEREGRAELFAMAADAERHSPNLAAELRWLACR